MNEFQNRTAAVIGLARAGVPAAKFLLEHGAKVLGYDSKVRDSISPQALALEEQGVTLYTGEHNFAGIENADLIVLSPGLKVHYEPLASIIEAAEQRGAEVIGELELASRFCPCPIIGVTGTKGKSTTTKLITEMLRACGVDAIAAGNTGTPLIEVLPQLSAESWAIVEVSSFQLEKAPTFRPRVAVLLSLLEDHQDYHPTLEQYWETKLRLFSNQQEGDTAVFNIDDPRVKNAWWHGEVDALSKRGHFEDEWGFKDVYVIPTSGGDIPTDVQQTLIFWKDDVLGESTSDGEFLPIIAAKDVPLSGLHNRANLAAALGAVRGVVSLGNHAEVIAEAIRQFQSLPHRLEIVARKDGVTWVNDSQSTIPDAAIAALKAFPAPVSLILGGRAKIGAESYENLLRSVRDAGAKIYLIGEAAPLLQKVAEKMGVEKSQILDAGTLAEAVHLAKINSASLETVVLSPACASFDQFTSYEERGNRFRELVGEL